MSPDRRLTTEEQSDIGQILFQQKQMSKDLEAQFEQNKEILRRIAAFDTALALGNQRMNQMDAHLEATDTQVAAVKTKCEETKIPITGITALVAAIGTWIAPLFGKHP